MQRFSLDRSGTVAARGMDSEHGPGQLLGKLERIHLRVLEFEA